MRTFRLELAYDGTAFHGWQAQPGLRTVQGELASAIARVVGDPVGLPPGAGRTDAGVHARGQVASFNSATRLPAHALAPLLNRHLPADVRVRAAREATEGFHARHAASARRYSYRVLREPDVMLARFGWCPPRPFEADRLVRSTLPLAGAHDFTSFRAAGCSASRAHVRMMRIDWRRVEGGVALDLVADHFLYHMVRNIVGTALRCATAVDPARAMAMVLAARDRRAAGPTAPPQGLCLEQVFESSGGAS